LPLFRSALEVSDSPNARLYVARCLRSLGRLVEAYEEMSATAREATRRAETEDKYVSTRDASAAELALLEPKVGKLVIAFDDASSGNRVTIDGAAIAPERLGSPIPLMPGKVVVEATSPAGTVVRREVTVSGGKTASVALTFSGAATSPPPETPEAPPAPPDVPESSGIGTVRALGIVTAGVGVVGLVVFGITGSMANDRFATLERECGGVQCSDLKYGDVVDEGQTLDLVANIGLIGGAVLLVTGGAMILFGGPGEPSEPSAAVSAAFGPRGGALELRGTF
jgi:hypothetical protein